MTRMFETMQPSCQPYIANNAHDARAAIAHNCIMSNSRRPYSRLPLFLREWRQHRGLTQDQLSEMTGIIKSTLSRLENRAMPINERHLYKLADALGCEPLDLIAWNPSDQESLKSKLLRVPGNKRREAGRILDVLAEREAPAFEHEAVPED